MADGDRTEKPSERRLRDARKKGQVARSRDAGQAAALLAALITFAYFGPQMLETSSRALAAGLRNMGEGTGDLTVGDATAAANAGLLALAWIVGPLAALSVVAVVVVQGVQSGWVFAGGALAMKWDRLSPAHGLKRLGGTQGGADALKAILVTAGLGLLAWQSVQALVGDASLLLRLTPEAGGARAWASLVVLLKQSAVVLGAVALADLGLARWRHRQSLRMTKAEVREEARLLDGSPEAKARVRRIQRDLARRRMMRDVPRATVVVTNPTHYAVALEYRRSEMTAPRVVAKGQNLVAQRIKDIAREHGVPVVENVPLAQALYRSVDVGDAIPPELFDAVAEVLAYLIRLRRLTL